MKKSVFLIALTMLAGSGTLSASLSQTYTHTTGQALLPINDVFTLPGFNTALGTLLSIEIKLTNNSVATVRINNTSSTPQSYSDASALVNLTVEGPDGTTNTVVTTAGPFSGIAAPNGNTFRAGSLNTNTTSTFVASSNFSSYTSSALLNFSAAAKGGVFSGSEDSSAGNLNFGGFAKEGGVTTLIYTYDPVATPEPAMFGALSIGMIGLGFAARKRFIRN